MTRLLASSSPSSSSSQIFRRKSRIAFARYALIGGAVTTILLLFWISAAGVVDEHRSSDLSFLPRARKDRNFQESEDDRGDESERRGGVVGARSCATVEEMGEVFAGGFEKESLRVRGLIKRHFEINGRFQGAADAVAVQFFLKNIHPGMKTAASVLLGHPESLQSRPNVFGELMRVIISPSQAIQEAVNWVLNGADPDVSLHMRMLTNRSIRAIQAALNCIKRAVGSYQHQVSRPMITLVSDTPSLVTEIAPKLTEFAEVIYFNYKSFVGNISSGSMKKEHQPVGFRAKDWGPAPRWVAFVDFFLASRAKHAVISGAHRRVGTTYAQLVAALAAANRHGADPTSSDFSFFSSFQSNLLVNGLARQVGWGHAWNRFAGPLSCRHQHHQCAFTPLLPPAWWDGDWQSPIPRDIQRLQDYGVRLTEDGKVDEVSLESYCRSRKDRVKTVGVWGL